MRILSLLKYEQITFCYEDYLNLVNTIKNIEFKQKKLSLTLMENVPDLDKVALKTEYGKLKNTQEEYSKKLSMIDQKLKNIENNVKINSKRTDTNASYSLQNSFYNANTSMEQITETSKKQNKKYGFPGISNKGKQDKWSNIASIVSDRNV